MSDLPDDPPQIAHKSPERSPKEEGSIDRDPEARVEVPDSDHVSRGEAAPSESGETSGRRSGKEAAESAKSAQQHGSGGEGGGQQGYRGDHEPKGGTTFNQRAEAILNEGSKTTITHHGLQIGDVKALIGLLGKGSRQSFAQESDRLLSDPTTGYHPNVEKNYQFGDISEHAEQLSREGAILVTCDDLLILDLAGLALAKHIDRTSGDPLRTLKVRTLKFPSVARLLQILSRHSLIGESSSGADDGGTDVLLQVMVKDQWFLKGLADERRELSELVGSLSGKNFHLVFLIEPVARPRGDTPAHLLPEWRIDFLSILLRSEIEREEELADICEEIERLQAEEKLPRTGTELSGQLRHQLRGGLGKLRAGLGTASAREATSRHSKARELFNNAGPLLRACAFLASRMNPLPVPQFEILLKALLAKIEDELPYEEITEEVAANGEKVEKIIKKTKKVDSFRRWLDDDGSLIEEMGIALLPGDRGALCVTFEEMGMSEVMRNTIPKKYEFKQISKLLDGENSLLLSPSTPDEIGAMLRGFTCEVAVTFPDLYNGEWLISQLEAIDLAELRMERHNQAQVVAKMAGNEISGVAHDYDALAGKYVELSQLKSELGQRFRNQLAELCRSLLSFEASSPLRVVESFLTQLIRRTRNLSLVPVIEMAGRLENAPNFQYLYWIRRILDSGNHSARSAALSELIRRSAQSQRDFPKDLREIAAWHPDREATGSSLSNSNVISLAFLLFHSEYYRRSKRAADLRRPANRHPLFGGDWVSEESRAIPGFLAAWLSHPRFSEAVRIVLKQEETSPDSDNPIIRSANLRAHDIRQATSEQLGISAIATILENWCVEVWGNPVFEALLDGLTAPECLDKKKLSALRKVLRTRSQDLRSEQQGADRHSPSYQACAELRRRLMGLVSRLSPENPTQSAEADTASPFPLEP